MPFENLPRIALIQMAVEPGRPDRNTARMLARLDTARDGGAEIVVFSELCIPGYFLGDLWEVDALVRDFAAWSEVIRAGSRALTVIFGNVAIDEAHIGEDGRVRKYNAVVVCHDGDYLERAGLPAGLPAGIHPKTLQPNYRVFDDDRHFYSLRKLAAATGTPVEAWMVPFEIPRAGGTFRFGVQLCEDIWCQDYWHQGDTLDTLRAFHAAGAQAVFNLSASPWTWQKNDKRNRTVREVLRRSPLPFFYVNHVGAQNNGKNVIVFDGDTTAYSPGGDVLRRAPAWSEFIHWVPDDGGQPAPVPGELEAIHRALLTGLRHLDHIRGGAGRYLVGVSGGIDSSLVTALLCQAFGPHRVFAVNMPTRFNSERTRRNAEQLCRNLGVDYLSCPIEDLYRQLSARIRGVVFPRSAGAYTSLVDENLQARIRGADILSGIAAMHGLVFTNNGNKTEVALGYATLYGDVNGAIAPIADLYKTQVFALARHLNQAVFNQDVIPANLYDGTTVPSAELSAAQDITRGLGDPIKYGYHDALLRQMIEYRRHPVDLLRWWLGGEFFHRLEWHDRREFDHYFDCAEAWLRDLEWTERQLRGSYFKRIQAPPIIVVSKRAFGFDLRESQLPPYTPRAYTELRQQVLDARWRGPVRS